MKKVDLIDYDETNQSCIARISSFPRYDIPFLRSRNNDLSISNLLFRELTISSQF